MKFLINLTNWFKGLFIKDTGKSISILLGAGFSAPMGYPIGNKLNEAILNCKGDDFAFHTSGVLCSTLDDKKPDFGYKTSYDYEFDFCRDLIEHFHKEKGYFDYEEFYDYFTFDAINDPKVQELYQPEKYATQRDLGGMLWAIRNIYVQIIARYLVDMEGNSWYDNTGYIGGSIFTGYTGILNYFKHIKDSYEINVHTLNHDLFFESLSHSDWIQGMLCDGFEELGSPYYGDLNVDHRIYKCRLQRYTGRYNSSFRLFKLHGSKDYGIFYESGKGSSLTPDKYIKTRHGIGFGELYKERQKDDGELHYDRCWVNYHADFLTGTTSKITRYKEPLLFEILFKHFQSNLKKAEKLIIIGYGAKDSEINRMLEQSFDFKNKQVYIIDPFPSSALTELKDRLNAKLITKHLDNIEVADLS